MGRRMTAPSVRARKVRDGAEPLVMLTAYDYPSAKMASDAGADMILVGDSLAMVVLGYPDTLQVTVDDMVHHIGAVARAKPTSLIVGDMPWMSFHVSVEDTVRNAARLIRAGAQAIKMEGGIERLAMIEALTAAEMPVMGHIGLTPQSVNAMGGFKVQGRKAEGARELVEQAKALDHAGCFALVLEGIPVRVAELITESVGCPTIGIGAGNVTDGQVLVFHDVLGLQDDHIAKFVRQYANLKADSISALQHWAADVRSGSFPDDSESYHIADDEAEALGLYGSDASSNQ